MKLRAGEHIGNHKRHYEAYPHVVVYDLPLRNNPLRGILASLVTNPNSKVVRMLSAPAYKEWAAWAKENLAGEHHVYYRAAGFMLETDAVLFMLTFEGTK